MSDTHDFKFEAPDGKMRKACKPWYRQKNGTSGIFLPYKMGISGIILHKSTAKLWQM